MIPGSLDELRTARMRLVRLTPVDGADLLNMHNNPHGSPTLGGPATETMAAFVSRGTVEHGSATVGVLDCPRPLDRSFSVVRIAPSNRSMAATKWNRLRIRARSVGEKGWHRIAPNPFGSLRRLNSDLICFTLPTNRASQRVIKVSLSMSATRYRPAARLYLTA